MKIRSEQVERMAARGYVSTEQIALAVGFARATIAAMVASKVVDGTKLGGVWWVKLASMRAHLGDSGFLLDDLAKTGRKP